MHRRRVGHGDLDASLVLIFPLLLAYEIGVLFTGRVNGADVVTRALYASLGSRALYLLVHAAIAVGVPAVDPPRRSLGHAARSRSRCRSCSRPRSTRSRSARAITLVLATLLGLGARPAARSISALGAGVHEELVFRLGLLAGLVVAAARRRARGRRSRSRSSSSLLFAAAHHLGAARRAVHGCTRSRSARSPAPRSARSSGSARSRTRSTRTCSTTSWSPRARRLLERRGCRAVEVHVADVTART